MMFTLNTSLKSNDIPPLSGSSVANDSLSSGGYISQSEQSLLSSAANLQDSASSSKSNSSQNNQDFQIGGFNVYSVMLLLAAIFLVYNWEKL